MPTFEFGIGACKLGDPKGSLLDGSAGVGRLAGEPSEGIEGEGESLSGALAGKLGDGLVGRFPG